MRNAFAEKSTNVQSIDYSGSDVLEIMAEAVKYNAFLTNEVLSHAPKSGHVLDFGAGIGTFSAPVAKLGLQVTCVEYDDGQRSKIKELHGLASVKRIESVADASIDYVFTLNVLEHIEDDVKALKQLYRVLKPGGRLYVFVPAFQLLYSEFDRRIGHYRRYHKAGLVQAVAKADFQDIEARYYDSLGFAAALAYKLVSKQDGKVSPSTVGIYDRYVFPVSRLLDIAASPFIGKNVGLTARKAL